MGYSLFSVTSVTKSLTRAPIYIDTRELVMMKFFNNRNKLLWNVNCTFILEKVFIILTNYLYFIGS